MKILFVCIENSCRSQIAEAFARIHGKDHVDPYSAGSQPSGAVNATAVESMRECNYDLSGHDSKSLDEVPQWKWDVIVTMGCGDACPNVPAKNREDWDIRDPKNMPLSEFRVIREEIEKKVKRLIQTTELDNG